MSDATAHTQQFNEDFLARLPEVDTGWEDATEGLVERFPRARIENDRGEVVFDVQGHDFFDPRPPATANPSLWRLSRLNALHGLFRVTDRILQIRGIDISNMTVVLGDSGYIVVDPLLSVETAKAGLELVHKHFGLRPVTGVIYTHCHLDHFGGVEGVVSPEQVRDEGIPVVAPSAFVQHAINENVYAGAAEARRNEYMFGALLEPGPEGHITSGIGVATSTGSSTLIAPNVTVPREGLDLTIDGVAFRFDDASGAEAPSELHFFMPQWSVVCLAENATQVMHNLYTLRGAPVRDALLWSDALDGALEAYGEAADIAIMSHHWPIRGRERIRDFLVKQRDMYRFIHDETLRLANHGYRPGEIAERIELPDALARFWPNRGTYGSLKVNARAVYQRYLGWFDGNPATLDPLPPADLGRRYVDALGGADRAVEIARGAFVSGDYRWAAELLSHVLAPSREGSDPDTAARELQAEVFEQMGFQAEAATWRNFYLSAAQELRTGDRSLVSRGAAPRRNFAHGMSRRMLFDYLAIRFDGGRGADLQGRILVRFADCEERWTLEIGNGVVHAHPLRRGETHGLEVEFTTAGFSAFAQGFAGTEDARCAGDDRLLARFAELLDTFSGRFDLARPNR